MAESFLDLGYTACYTGGQLDTGWTNDRQRRETWQKMQEKVYKL
jgi:hypothetical protein